MTFSLPVSCRRVYCCWGQDCMAFIGKPIQSYEPRQRVAEQKPGSLKWSVRYPAAAGGKPGPFYCQGPSLSLFSRAACLLWNLAQFHISQTVQCGCSSRCHFSETPFYLSSPWSRERRDSGLEWSLVGSVQKMEAGESEGQGHSCVQHAEVEASLAYRRPCLKKDKNRNKQANKKAVTQECGL